MAIYGHANIKHELMGISALLSILLVFKQASARSCFLHPTPLFLKQGSRTTRSTPTRSTTTTTFSRIRATKTSLSSTNTQNESQSQSTLNPRYLAAQMNIEADRILGEFQQTHRHYQPQVESNTINSQHIHNK